MSEHTPGPWKARPGGAEVITAYAPEGVRAHGYGCGNDFIADLNDGEYHEYYDRAEQEANARLIAAAPELLEALEELADLVDDLVDGIYRPDSFTTQPARAAIAKAKGESNE